MRTFDIVVVVADDGNRNGCGRSVEHYRAETIEDALSESGADHPGMVVLDGDEFDTPTTYSWGKMNL